MVAGVLLPTRCPVCGAAGAVPCRRCATRLRRAPAAPPPDGLDACRALLVYEGASRRLVTSLKYHNDRAVLTWLAGHMAELLVPPPGAVVTWAPTSRRRRRRRGYDQAELLARAVARRWGRPCLHLLVRAGERGPQTGHGVAERRRGPVFRARAGSSRPLRTPVVVVDDVTTTGSTLAAAARALTAAGAPWVGAITAARTPRHRPETLPSVSHSSRDEDKSLKLAGKGSE
jgi:predicted amidophosphoribosyltransferase